LDSRVHLGIDYFFDCFRHWKLCQLIGGDLVTKQEVLRQVNISVAMYIKTGDREHLKDVNRILRFSSNKKSLLTTAD